MTELLKLNVEITDEERKRGLSRRAFITRMMAFTGCAAAGLLLEAAGSPVLAQGGQGTPPSDGPGSNEDAVLPVSGWKRNFRRRSRIRHANNTATSIHPSSGPRPAQRRV